MYLQERVSYFIVGATEHHRCRKYSLVALADHVGCGELRFATPVACADDRAGLNSSTVMAVETPGLSIWISRIP